MEKEALSAAQQVEQQLKNNHQCIQNIVRAIKHKPPHFAITVARGSSDHAATFAKYLFELHLGRVTASAAPSVMAIYEQTVAMTNALVVGISQSGKSPDICRYFDAAARQNAHTVAMINTVNSPMGELAKHIVPLNAGLENAVAATKSFITTLTAMVHFTAVYTDDQTLLSKLYQLPDALAECCQMKWDGLLQELALAQNLYIMARGYGLPIAQEAALKLKETTGLHAEAYSAAEILHGPFALIKENFPVLILGQNDASCQSTLAVTKRMTELKAKTFLAMPGSSNHHLNCSYHLPMPDKLHPILDPILNIQSFYMMAAQLAVLRGYDPDRPDNLMKVTETH